jgi:hypothetical protein
MHLDFLQPDNHDATGNNRFNLFNFVKLHRYRSWIEAGIDNRTRDIRMEGLPKISSSKEAKHLELHSFIYFSLTLWLRLSQCSMLFLNNEGLGLRY